MTTPFLALRSGENVLSEASLLLQRQITEFLWDSAAGVPSLDAFGPQKADQRKPSFSRSDVQSPQQSRDWHNANAKSPSLSVWACSVSEVQEIDTRAIDDSGVPGVAGDPPKAPGHCYVDYQHTNRVERKAIKGYLLAKAIKREELPTV